MLTTGLAFVLVFGAAFLTGRWVGLMSGRAEWAPRDERWRELYAASETGRWRAQDDSTALRLALTKAQSERVRGRDTDPELDLHEAPTWPRIPSVPPTSGE